MNILVIANCRLGDSLIMLPSLKLLRKHDPDAHIALASETASAGFVAAKDILAGRGVVDDFLPMHAPKNRFARLLARLHFIVRCRRTRWDLGIVLMPPVQPLTTALIRRFTLYLRLCGAPRIVVPDAILQPHPGDDDTFAPMPSVVDLTLRVLATLGFELPPEGQADIALPPTTTQPAILDLPETPLLAVAPGANMPCKCWPLERYRTVLERFCKKHGATPVYFGGENERQLCEALHASIPGVTCIGRPMPFVEALMRRCALFLGNDTGLGHLAAAVGLPCVSIHSCRDIPGLWEPYARNKTVLRTRNIPCANCLKTTCPKVPQPCLDAVTPQMVLDALEQMRR